MWLRCHDCVPPRSFREPDYRRHVDRDHPERPEKDALTLAEVAAALGIGRRRAGWLVERGKLRHFRVGAGFGAKRWVRKKDLQNYVRDQIELHPEKAAEWARTGTFDPQKGPA